jgi:hypothetical protein
LNAYNRKGVYRFYGLHAGYREIPSTLPMIPSMSL